MDQETVTKKEKNPKNVEKGKRLAEWNKKNKDEIRKLREVKDAACMNENRKSDFDMSCIIIAGIPIVLMCTYYCWKRSYKSEVIKSVDKEPKIKPVANLPKVVSTMD